MSSPIPPGTRPQVAGWYPDPAGSGGQRWHDGEGWTAQVVHGTTETRTLGPGFARLADWLGRMLALMGVVYLLLAIAMLVLWLNAPDVDLSSTATVAGDPTEQAQSSGSGGVEVLVNLLFLGFYVLTGVTWLVWQYQLAVAAPRRLRNSPAGHVGWWFVPVANLVVPRRALGDLWHAYGTRRAGDPAEPTPWVFSVWWALWLTPIFFFPMVVVALFRSSTPDAAVSSVFGISVLLLLGYACAGFTARLVVRDLSWRALVYHSTLG